MTGTLGQPNVLCPINWSHPLNDKRLAWWMSIPSWDGGTQLRDLCGLYHGAFTSMANANNGWRDANARPGQLAKSVLLDGSAGYMAVGNPVALRLQKPFSLAAWFRTPRTDGYNAILAHTTAFSNTATPYSLVVQNTGVIYCDRQAGNSLNSPGSTIAANTWYRGVAVYGASATTLYVNAAQVATGAAAPTLTYSGSLQLGCYVAGGGHFRGQLDDITIWGRELSAQDVADDYRLSQRGYPGVINRLEVPFLVSSSWFMWQKQGGPLLRSL